MATLRILRRLPPRSVVMPWAARGDVHLRAATTTWLAQALRWCRSSLVDIAWVVFVGLNLAAMRLLPDWQTVPFLAIWVSLTVIYGFRLWRLQPTILTFAAVTIATGGIITVQVADGQQDADYLAEVPLVALMFLVMVWHGRRRLAAMTEKLAAMDAVERVSQENLRLLKQQHRFLQDASHELGTPIAVALGHAELLERAATPAVADDARVIADELRRLRRLSTRMLLLASSASPGFLHAGPVTAESLLDEALERWGHIPRRWNLGTVADAAMLADRDRLAVALDALIENAIAHTTSDGRIELSARCENDQVVVAVADTGCGIEAGDLERIFQRFTKAGAYRSREAGGFGLGLAIAQAIAEAHHGSVRVHSTPGQGSTFELALPVASASATAGKLEPSQHPAAGPRAPVAPSPPSAQAEDAAASRA
jgi:signal transduction histidine kinase